MSEHDFNTAAAVAPLQMLWTTGATSVYCLFIKYTPNITDGNTHLY